MSEAGLEQRLQRAEAAVVKAQAAYDKAHDGSKDAVWSAALGRKEGTGAAEREADTETYSNR